MQKKRWKSTPWKMGSSLFDGVDWERWKKNKIPLELLTVPTASELLSLRSRRNKKEKEEGRRREKRRRKGGVGKSLSDVLRERRRGGGGRRWEQRRRERKEKPFR